MAAAPPSRQGTTANLCIDELQESEQALEEQIEDCIVAADLPVLSYPPPQTQRRIASSPPRPLPLPTPPFTPATQKPITSSSTTREKNFRVDFPSPEKAEYDRIKAKVRRSLDSRWGQGAWQPPSSLHRTKKALSLKETGNILRNTKIAQAYGIDLKSLYQNGGVIYEAAAIDSAPDPPSWSPQTTALALQLLNDRLGIIDTLAQSQPAAADISMAGRGSNTARRGRSSTKAQTPVSYDQRRLGPPSSQNEETSLPSPGPNLPQRPPTAGPGSASTPSQRHTTTPQSSFSGIQRAGSHAESVRSQTPSGRSKARHESEDVTSAISLINNHRPLTKADMLKLQYLSPYTKRNDKAVLSPLDMEKDATYTAIHPSQRPKGPSPHTFFVMVRHSQDYWTLLHAQERMKDKQVDIHHYDTNPCSERDGAVRAKLDSWATASFGSLRPTWNSEKCPKEKSITYGSSGIVSLLTLYVLMGRRKLPKPAWPTPSVRSWLRWALQEPEAWKEEVDKVLSDAPEQVDEGEDDGHVHTGSDSGVDLSRDMSLPSDQSPEATESQASTNATDVTNGEGNGRKRSREASDNGDSSANEPSSEPPAKKSRIRNRGHLAQEFDASLQMVRHYYRSICANLNQETRRQEQQLEDAQKEVTKANDAIVTPQREYVAQKQVRIEAEQKQSDFAKGLKDTANLPQSYGAAAADMAQLFATLQEQCEKKFEESQAKTREEQNKEDTLKQIYQKAAENLSQAVKDCDSKEKDLKENKERESECEAYTQFLDEGLQKLLSEARRKFMVKWRQE